MEKMTFLIYNKHLTEPVTGNKKPFGNMSSTKQQYNWEYNRYTVGLLVVCTKLFLKLFAVYVLPEGISPERRE